MRMHAERNKMYRTCAGGGWNKSPYPLTPGVNQRPTGRTTPLRRLCGAAATASSAAEQACPCVARRHAHDGEAARSDVCKTFAHVTVRQLRRAVTDANRLSDAMDVEQQQQSQSGRRAGPAAAAKCCRRCLLPRLVSLQACTASLHGRVSSLVYLCTLNSPVRTLLRHPGHRHRWHGSAEVAEVDINTE